MALLAFIQLHHHSLKMGCKKFDWYLKPLQGKKGKIIVNFHFAEELSSQWLLLSTGSF